MSTRLTFVEVLIIVAIGLILASAMSAMMKSAPEHAAPPANGDNTTCVGGIAMHRGEVLIVNGNTVKCTP